MPLFLREADVEALVSPADAVAAVEASLARFAAGAADAGPRFRLGLPDGEVAVGAAADDGLAAGLAEAGPLAVLLDASGGAAAVLEARHLRALTAGAAAAIAAKRLARPSARSVGLLGTGAVGTAALECLRTALPALDRVVAYSRDRGRLAEFCARHGAELGEYNRDAAEQDVVVTATTSRDPVLRGEWLRAGALVCALGATRRSDRELDNAVVERASFICCDSVEAAQREAGDLVEPVERDVLDWLEVHELAADERGRGGDADIVLYKSVGLAPAVLAVGALAVDRAT